jgi:hypothetical protein
MAILRPADPEAALRQGDLLDDVITATADGDTPHCSVPGMVLVVSRNCQAMRSENVIVARVVKQSLDGLKEEAETLDDLLAFFAEVRDGDGQPDTFYLGELQSGSSDRYAAKFDRLFTIKVPEAKEERAAYLKKHRRSSLTMEFIHDLHQRLFRAFASLGFDDEGWFTDADLNLIRTFGESRLRSLDAEVATARTRLEIVKTSGGNKKEEKDLNRTIDETENKARKVRELLAPLQSEAKRRAAASSPEPSKANG